MALRQLPAEILDLIVASMPESNTSVALPTSHLVTRTLWSCLFVSKTMHASSLQELYRRCLYIDSAWRLRAVLRAYSSRQPIFGRSADPGLFKSTASTALYLAPFTKDTIDERPVVDGICKLFKLLSQSLERLIIDMPLRSYYPDEPGSQSLRSVLRSAFLYLGNLRELVSIRDELYVSTRLPDNNSIVEPPVWSTWAHLRRLALYNLCIDDDLTESLKSMTNLRELVLTRPDTDEDVDRQSRHWDTRIQVAVVNSYRDLGVRHRLSLESIAIPSIKLPPDATKTSIQLYSHLAPGGEPSEPPVLNIICIDGQNPLRDRRSQLPQPRNRFGGGNNWAAYDLRDTYNDIRECQQWVKRSALDGSLWS